MNDPVPFESPRKVVPRETESLPERKVGMGKSPSSRVRICCERCWAPASAWHCMTPAQDRRSGSHRPPQFQRNGALPGKYADTAIPELLRQMERLGGSLPHISAKLAEEATCSPYRAPDRSAIRTGPSSICYSRRLHPRSRQALWRSTGRKMVLNVETGRVTVEIIGSPLVEL